MVMLGSKFSSSPPLVLTSSSADSMPIRLVLHLPVRIRDSTELRFGIHGSWFAGRTRYQGRRNRVFVERRSRRGTGRRRGVCSSSERHSSPRRCRLVRPAELQMAINGVFRGDPTTPRRPELDPNTGAGVDPHSGVPRGVAKRTGEAPCSIEFNRRGYHAG